MGVGGIPADLVVGRFDDETRCGNRYQDRRDLATPGSRAGDGGHGDQPGDVGAGVGDELLRAIDHPVPVVQARGGLCGTGIGTAAGLGQAEGTECGTTGQLRQPFPLLRLSAEPVDRHRTEGDTALQGDGHALVDLGEFLQRQAQGEVVATHAAVLLRERQSEKAHIGHAGDDLVREGVLGVVLGSHRCDDLAGEVAHRLDKLLVLIRKSSGGQECGPVFAHCCVPSVFALIRASNWPTLT